MTTTPPTDAVAREAASFEAWMDSSNYPEIADRLQSELIATRKALEEIRSQAKIAMDYAENERKLPNVPTTMEFQVQHVLDIVARALPAPEVKG